MTLPSAIIDLKEFLPEDSWSQVISALRQDSLVWAVVQDSKIRGSAKEKFGPAPEAWSPANLALILLEYNLQASDLRNMPHSLPDELIERAEQLFEKLPAEDDIYPNLNNAGLLAIALREKTEHWPHLFSQSKLLRAALACLFGLIAEPSQLILALPVDSAIHVIFANPLDETKKLDLLSQRLGQCSADERLSSLNSLASRNPELASELTHRLATQIEDSAQSTQPNQGKTSQTKGVTSSLQPPISNLQSLIHQADYQHLAANPQDAHAALLSAQIAASQIHTIIALQTAQAAVQSGNPAKALELWAEFSGDQSQEASVALALTLINLGYIDEAEILLPACTIDNETSAGALLVSARLAAQRGEYNKANVAAKQSALLFADQKEHLPTDSGLILLLLDLNLNEDVINLASGQLERNPNDPQTTHYLAMAHLQAGVPEQALSWAHLAIALAPDNIEFRRGLATILEYLGEWQSALKERQAVVELDEEYWPSDQHALAICALKAGYPERTQEITQKIIRFDAFDGQAHSLLGQALIDLDKPEDGIQYIEKAVQLSPEQPQAWLALAHLQICNGELNKAQQTLLTASRAASDSAEIHLALGQAYLANKAQTKSLSSFRRAYELAETSDAEIAPDVRANITCTFGKALLDLGHTEDAHMLLEESYRRSPVQPGIAHVYAKALIKIGQPKNAIAPLTSALESAPQDLDIQQDLAFLQLETRSDLEQAELNLKHILNQEPNRALAKGLLAKTLEINKKPQEALEMYNLALGTLLTQDSVWYKTLALGLSRMALSQNQPDTALAALEMAYQKHPDNSELARNLATVYHINQLPDKAMQVASATFQANLTDLEIIFWFVNFSLELKKPKQSRSALKKAILVHPNIARLHLMLADLHLQLDDIKAANKSFDQVAEMENSTARELSMAADGLSDVQDYDRAVYCLERARTVHQIQAQPEGAKHRDGFLLNLYTKLSDAHSASKDHQAALSALEEALTIRPHETKLEQKRAILLVELGQLERAAAWIQAALEHSPDDPDLNLQGARIHRVLGKLPEAHHFLQKTLALPGYANRMAAVVESADLALSMMQSSSARRILGEGSREIKRTAKNPSLTTKEELFSYYCLIGELALSENEEIAAADALTTAMKISSRDPRALALKARLRLRQGGLKDANKTLELGMKALGEDNHTQSASSARRADVHIALALAALECQAWSPAVYLLKEAIKFVPQEPRAYIELARSLVLRAEHQRLCQAVHISQHAPGIAITSDDTYQQFEQTIIAATKTLREIRSALEHPEELQALLSTWLSRGQAAFKPSVEHAHALSDLPQTPDNQAAHLAALRESQAHRSAAKLATEMYAANEDRPIEHPALLAQIALALIQAEPNWAASAAQQALDISGRRNMPNFAVYYAVKATIAQQAQNHPLLLDTIHGLQAVWDDEPYWHSLAAEILLSQGKSAQKAQQAVEHMEKAIQLEPLKVEHYKILGQAHFNSENIRSALQSFNRASSLAPADPEPQLALAQVFHTNGDSRQANKYAKKAIELGPKNPEALKLLAKIAIDRGAPEETLLHAGELIKANPGDYQAMLLQAEALTMLKKPAEALIALEAATARMLPTASLLLKTISLKRQVYGEKAALESLHNLAGQYPHDLDIAFELAQALADRGKQNDAIQTAQQSLAAATNEATPEQRSRLHHMLGMLLRRSGQLDHAVSNLSSAIDHQPDWVEPYVELGRTYYERRQYDLALQTYQQAIRISPNDARSYHWAGMALKDTNDYFNAEIMLRKAADLDPDDVSIQRKLAAVVTLNLVHNPTRQVKTKIKAGSQ